MGLTSYKHDPCLFFRIIDDSPPPVTPRHTIHVGLYVNDSVSFSESDAEDSCFKKLPNNKVTTDFMGNADFFLRSPFECN